MVGRFLLPCGVAGVDGEALGAGGQVLEALQWLVATEQVLHLLSPCVVGGEQGGSYAIKHIDWNEEGDKTDLL